MNQMTVRDIWSLTNDEKRAAQIMGMGCEPDAYDPMEKAMVVYCEKQGITIDILFGGELVKTCTKAGVRVVMITGDNGITASLVLPLELI